MTDYCILAHTDEQGWMYGTPIPPRPSSEGARGSAMNERRSPMRNVARMVMVVMGLQLSLVGHLWAFAIGDITVHSRRGEPFAAEVRLLLEPREREKDIEVTLGNQEAYRGEDLKRAAVIDALRASVLAGARDVIQLSSTAPVQESAFDLVLSVRAGRVTIVKHYHVILPAPGPAAAQLLVPLPTIAPVAPAALPPKVAYVAPASKATTKSPRPVRRTERYGPIERGETLYSVAKGLHVPHDKI